MSEVRYPDVEVELSGREGNAFFIIGRVSKALRQAGICDEEIALFQHEAESGDYDNVLRTCMRWVDCA